MMTTDTEPVPIKHGYATADLDRLAGAAVRWTPWKFLPFDERVDIAHFAIVEHILVATERPGFWPLVFVGQKAINRHIAAEGRWRGYYLSGSKSGTPITNHFGYWHGSTRLRGSSLDDRVVEKVALWQIWPKLSKGQRATLLAIAKHNNFDKAAAELGTTHHALMAQLFAARKRFLRWWHEDEKPSYIWGCNIPRDPSKYPSYRGVATGIIRGRERRAARANGRDAPNRQDVKSGGPKAGEASCR